MTERPEPITTDDLKNGWRNFLGSFRQLGEACTAWRRSAKEDWQKLPPDAKFTLKIYGVAAIVAVLASIAGAWQDRPRPPG